MSPTPRELLARHTEGDPEATPALCRRLLPVARALALAGTLTDEGAAEVAGAALRRCAERLAEADSPSRRLPLLEETVREQLRAFVRKQGGRTTELVAIPAERAAAVRGATVDLEAVFGEFPPPTAARMLLEASGWLPEQYQAVFLLRHLEGLGYGEIAELTGSTAAETGRTVAAARKLYERELVFHLKKLANP